MRQHVEASLTKRVDRIPVSAKLSDVHGQLGVKRTARGGISLRFLIATLLVALALGALFQFSKQEALERTEALRFRRMLATRLGEKGAYRFFFVTNRRAERTDW